MNLGVSPTTQSLFPFKLEWVPREHNCALRVQWEVCEQLRPEPASLKVVEG